MARIETYPFDTNITVNDYVIGTDGDNLNATKNYRVAEFIALIGTQYNLQTQDLLYTYNAVTSTLVQDAEISSNNFGDNPILMSGVTNFFVSKTTFFGQLVEDFLNSIASDSLNILVMDTADINNYGIFTISSAVDVNANTINLTVTPTSSNGRLITGRPIGISVQAAGGGTTGNFVTLDTAQTITGGKTFTGGIIMDDEDVSQSGKAIQFEKISGASFRLASATRGLIYFGQGGEFIIHPGSGQIEQQAIFAGVGSFSEERTFTLPNASGTVALTSDLPTGRTQFFNDLPNVAATNVGNGLGTVAVGNSVNIPADTIEGDVFFVSFKGTWFPRNGQDFDPNQLRLPILQGLSIASPWAKVEADFANISSRIDFEVDFRVIFLSITPSSADYTVTWTVKAQNFTTGQGVFTNTGVNKNIGATITIPNGNVAMFAEFEYTDTGTSEGTLSCNSATISRLNT